jgi:hypothetical protein
MSVSLPGCPICNQPLSLKLARGRKSGKAFIMLFCSGDGRHFRGFISYRPYVQEVLDKLDAMKPPASGD